jgi:hypothetical protein
VPRPEPLAPADVSMSRSPSLSVFVGPPAPRFLIPEGRPVVLFSVVAPRALLRWARGPEGAMVTSSTCDVGDGKVFRDASGRIDPEIRVAAST